jgi:hypothetical protein
MMRAHAYPSILLKNAREMIRQQRGHLVSPLQCAGARRLLPLPDLANGQCQGLGGSPLVPRSYEKHHTRSIKALEGITHPSKASGATPARCTHAHPSDSPLQTQKQIKSNPWSLVLKPLKECSTPPQARGYYRVSKYQGTPQTVKYDTPYDR